MEVGREIRRHREAKGWSQTKLAAAADMGVSGVSQIETGARNPSAVTLEKLARALDLEVADLFPKGQASLPDFENGQRRDSPPTFTPGILIQLIEEWERYLDNPTGPERRPAIAMDCYDLAGAIGREIAEAFQASAVAEKWDRGTATDADIAPWLEANEERGKVQDRLRRIAGKALDHYKRSDQANPADVRYLEDYRRDKDEGSRGFAQRKTA